VLSLNVNAIEKDVISYNEKGVRRNIRNAHFVRSDALWYRRIVEFRLRERPTSPYTTTWRLADDQRMLLAQLKSGDAEYREILTAAASLTSAMQGARLARAALWIAVASFAIALGTMLLADTSGHPLLIDVIDWLSGIASSLTQSLKSVVAQTPSSDFGFIQSAAGREL